MAGAKEAWRPLSPNTSWQVTGAGRSGWAPCLLTPFSRAGQPGAEARALGSGGRQSHEAAHALLGEEPPGGGGMLGAVQGQALPCPPCPVFSPPTSRPLPESQKCRLGGGSCAGRGVHSPLRRGLFLAGLQRGGERPGERLVLVPLEKGGGGETGRAAELLPAGGGVVPPARGGG